ncbi:radical SAM protein [Emergencia timonensis]|nr:radical SAM protein [Emergencia timonensis]WNX89268.1 radical SAM protein [Emergencia timonensis]
MSSHFREITCKQALNKLHSRRLPYSWDLNIYRGCAHKCEYCFALYTQDYMPDNDFFDTIYIKTNVVEQLEKQLASPSWKREIVNIGGVTDSYQPIEKERKMMPDILKLLIKYRTPCIISTKSDLILRDFDLIAELASITYVNVAATITCMDENVRQKIEPGGVPSLRRFQMLKEFAKTDASRGLHMMPIIPYLTDSDENLNALYSHGEDAKVSYALPGLLGLRGRTRRSFF